LGLERIIPSQRCIRRRVDENEDPKEIFWQECQMFFLQDYLSKCEIVDDGDILELQLKDSGEPVLVMVIAE